MRKAISSFLLCSTLLLTTVSVLVRSNSAWSNGGYSADPSNPDYGTHDWIAQHALDWLPQQEKQYILDNLAAYLYGTELPDNGGAPDGIGDTFNHHIYYSAGEVMTDDSAAIRASTEYTNTLNLLKSNDLTNAAKNAGVMSHYIADMAVFGHVMGAATDWGSEMHHSDYEAYMNDLTSHYTSWSDIHLEFDGSLDFLSAYDAAKNLAYYTTFDADGDLTCVWMDQNYDWENSTFRNRAGESVNLAVNYLTDVLHTLYLEAVPWGDWNHYHNYTEIVNTLLYLNSTYPDIVDVFSIGKSWQNKDIYCIRLTNENAVYSKPKLFFVGYHHAREPISAELPLYFVVQSATSYSINATITHMLDHSEIYIVVALNVDGFDSITQNEWQRKNSRPYNEDGDSWLDEDPPDDEDGDGYIEMLLQLDSGSWNLVRFEGIDDDADGSLNEDWVGGVDLNRNYGYQWDAVVQSGSTNPADEDFKGPAPFSEPETQALRDFVLQHEIKYAISFHSGAESIIYPWGYTTLPTADSSIFIEIASELSSLTGASYGQSGAWYTTSGVWDDWMYSNRSVLALTCEIYADSSAWEYEAGPTPVTVWERGIFEAFNPVPSDIESVVVRWLPAFTYTVNRAISETDTSAPSTTDDYDGLWHTKDFRINLTATDDSTEVEGTFYKINGGSTNNVSSGGQPVISTEGANNRLEYWSIDSAGNEEVPHKIVTGIKLDKTAPSGTVAINGGADYTNSTSAVLTVIAVYDTSGVSQMRFSYDNVTWLPWEPYTTHKTWSLTLGDGTKIVYIQFKDNAGLVSGFYSDTSILDQGIPAIAMISPEGGSEIRSSTVTVSWTASDDLSGVDNYRISLDNGSWVNVGVDATYTFNGLSEGEHAVDIEVVDKAGNTDGVSVRFIVNTSPLLGPGYMEEVAVFAIVFAAVFGVIIYRLKRKT